MNRTASPTPNFAGSLLMLSIVAPPDVMLRPEPLTGRVTPMIHRLSFGTWITQSNPSTGRRTLVNARRRVEPSLISRVFVVDDDRVIASTTAAILKLSGYDARSFVNPLEALEVARTVGPDLLIADVVMPGLSGIDLAVRLKDQCPTCKILLLSGQAETGDLLEAARRQGHRFEVLAKPIHPRDLLARIKEVDVSDMSVA
jgi:CheY-like chemotaxis protein